MTIRTKYDAKSGCYVASDGKDYATGLSHAEARRNLVNEQKTVHRFMLKRDAETVVIKFITPMRRRTVCDQASQANDFANRKVFSQPLSGGYWVPSFSA